MCAEFALTRFPGKELLVCAVAFSLLPVCGAGWLSSICLSRAKFPTSLNLTCYKGYSQDYNQAWNDSVTCNEAMVLWTEAYIKPHVYKLMYDKDPRLRKPFTCVYAELDIYYYKYDLEFKKYYFELNKEDHTKGTKRPEELSHFERSFYPERYHLFGCLYAGKPTVIEQFHERDELTANTTIRISYCDYNACNNKGNYVSAPPTRKRKLFDWPEPTGAMARLYKGDIIADPDSDDLTLNYCRPASMCSPDKGNGSYESFQTDDKTLVQGPWFVPPTDHFDPLDLHTRKSKGNEENKDNKDSKENEGNKENKQTEENKENKENKETEQTVTSPKS